MDYKESCSIFLNSIDTSHTPFLEELFKQAKADGIPVIRREMQSFLKVLLQMKKPERILEVGTAVGFSAILMAQYSPENCHITTIENYEKRIREAKKNIAASGFDAHIELLEGDASQILKELEGPYDLIFMDAAKGQYIHFLPEVLRLMKEGSILVSDNVLQDGTLLQSRFFVERRDRTIHARMREYLYALKHDPQLETCILPVGDGITLSVRKIPGERTGEE